MIACTSPLRKVVGLVSGQLDADRMDYLLRDSLFAGVDYGHYDVDRMIHSFVGFDEDKTVLLSRKAVPLAEQYVIVRYGKLSIRAIMQSRRLCEVRYV